MLDRSRLDYCGPGDAPVEEEQRRSPDEQKSESIRSSVDRRWLQPGLIGEEYAPCYSCPAAARTSPCNRVATYEFNDTVVSQCTTTRELRYENGTYINARWMVSLAVSYGHAPLLTRFPSS